MARELLKGAPGLWARSRFRRTRASSIFLVFFAGFGGIASMTALEVARRDATVIDRFVSYSALPELGNFVACPLDVANSPSGPGGSSRR